MKMKEKISDAYYCVRRFFSKTTYYKLKYGIKNLIAWFPVIWRDRDWDEWYLFNIMHKKLERMEKLHRNDGHFVRSEETADQIMVAKEALKRLIDDKYYEKACEYYGKEPYWDSKGITLSDGFIDFPMKTEEERALSLKINDLEEQMRQYDIEIVLSKGVAKNVRSWWD